MRKFIYALAVLFALALIMVATHFKFTGNERNLEPGDKPVVDALVNDKPVKSEPWQQSCDDTGTCKLTQYNTKNNGHNEEEDSLSGRDSLAIHLPNNRPENSNDYWLEIYSKTIAPLVIQTVTVSVDKNKISTLKGDEYLVPTLIGGSDMEGSFVPSYIIKDQKAVGPILKNMKRGRKIKFEFRGYLDSLDGDTSAVQTVIIEFPLRGLKSDLKNMAASQHINFVESKDTEKQGLQKSGFETIDSRGARLSTCTLKSKGETTYEDYCYFLAQQGNGGFSINPPNDGLFFGYIAVVSLYKINKNKGDVSGLVVPNGNNSRWGEATRSDTDPACWTGKNGEFEICAYALK